MASSLLSSMKDFFVSMYDEDNPAKTLRMYDIREGKRFGRVQFQWDKENACLIIKHIFLTPFGGIHNKYVVDKTSKEMLWMYPTLEAIIVENPKTVFALKYQSFGWNFNFLTNELYLQH